MSLSEIRNVVLLFSNPVWAGASTTPTTIIRNITALSSQIAYEQRITSNITTLTTTNADTLNGIIQGLLYVPDISRVPSCDAQQYDFIPHNVTRRNNLPPTNYNLVALAPWFSMNCTRAYLNSARADPIRAFLFYRPNDSANKPQDVAAAVWDLDDDGAWRKDNQYPIFALPGLEGQKMMLQLSLYSGSVDHIPHGSDITSLYGPNPKDYVRVWTELTMKTDSSLPALWVFLLIIVGALLLIISSISLTMHLVQRRRRESLRRRVESGEVDLEAMGVKRLTVPDGHVARFPLYTYNEDPDGLNNGSCSVRAAAPAAVPSVPSVPSVPVVSIVSIVPAVPTSPDVPPHQPASAPRGKGRGGSTRSTSSRKGGGGRRQDRSSSYSDTMSPSARSVRSTRSMRSKRSTFTGSDTTATNFQPNCHICLTAFKHRVTVIKELTCGHIFHPSCIDEFLLENSSLCPMCKQCMLPADYSPPITNGMVRRERALRRLRERVDVDVDYVSVESGESGSRFHGWKRRLFSSSSRSSQRTTTTTTTTSTAPILPAPESRKPTTMTTAIPATPEIEIPISGAAEGSIRIADGPPVPVPAPAPAAKKAVKVKARKAQPRSLRILPTQPEDVELTVVEPGRHSPSSFARKRMREIASENAPFDDPDQQRPKWRRVISGIFPGFT